MSKTLSATVLAGMGYKFYAEKQDNGRLRHRLDLPSGATVRIGAETPKGAQTSWENAHSHRGLIENLIIWAGSVAIAFDRLHEDGSRAVCIYNAPAIVSILPGEVHNVYPFAGSFMVAMKEGKPVGNPEKDGADWFPAPAEFQAWSRTLKEDDILRLGAE